MRTRWKAFVVAGLLIAGGTAAYHYWTPPTSGQQPTTKAGFRKKALGINGGEAVPVLAIDARIADVPVYLDGVGTARAGQVQRPPLPQPGPVLQQVPDAGLRGRAGG